MRLIVYEVKFILEKPVRTVVPLDSGQIGVTMITGAVGSYYSFIDVF